MSIRADAFAEIVQSLAAQNGASSTDADKKRKRPPMLGKLTLIPHGHRADRKPVAVVVRELTPSTIGLLHDKPMRTGDEFILCYNTKAGTVCGVVCTVTRWHPIGEHQFSITADFTGKVLTPSAEDAQTRQLKELERRLRQANDGVKD